MTRGDAVGKIHFGWGIAAYVIGLTEKPDGL